MDGVHRILLHCPSLTTFELKGTEPSTEPDSEIRETKKDSVAGKFQLT